MRRPDHLFEAALLPYTSVVSNAPRSCAQEELCLQRLLFPMINEAFNILDEGMAQRPADIDVCYVHGKQHQCDFTTTIL